MSKQLSIHDYAVISKFRFQDVAETEITWAFFQQLKEEYELKADEKFQRNFMEYKYLITLAMFMGDLSTSFDRLVNLIQEFNDYRDEQAEQRSLLGYYDYNK